MQASSIQVRREYLGNPFMLSPRELSRSSCYLGQDARGYRSHVRCVLWERTVEFFSARYHLGHLGCDPREMLLHFRVTPELRETEVIRFGEPTLEELSQFPGVGRFGFALVDHAC